MSNFYLKFTEILLNSFRISVKANPNFGFLQPEIAMLGHDQCLYWQVSHIEKQARKAVNCYSS
jgi:hypothetical protein